MKRILLILAVFQTLVWSVYAQQLDMVSVGTSHFCPDNIPPEYSEYSLSLDVRGDSIFAVSVEGPDISLTNLEYEQTFSGGQWRWHKDVGLTGKPSIGEIYSFHITFNNSTSKDTTNSITGIIEEFPTIISPIHESTIYTTIPTFEWSPLTMEIGGMDLMVIDLTPGEELMVWSIELPVNETSVVYSFDGSGEILEQGKTYGWVLIYRDALEDNSATLYNHFTISITKIIENEYDILSPLDFDLLQNYPNPFNPLTTISYHLPKSSFVKLSIYDISGKLIETLVNEQKNAGYYSVKWNAENVSSGVYLYKIDAADFSSVKKCLLVK